MKRFLLIICATVGMFLIIYSLLYFIKFNAGIGDIFSFTLGCLLLFIGIFYDKFLIHTQKGIRKIVRISIFSLLTIFFISFAIMSFSIYINSQNIPEKNKDALVVLGAGLYGDQVSPVLALRLDKAVEYLNENEETIALVSGGQGADELVSEAFAMKEYLIAHGIDDERILIEDKSTKTEENFAFSKVVLDKYFGSTTYDIVYVTNDFHIMRSGWYAENAGFDAEGLASETAPFFLPHYYFREYITIIWYFIFDSWG